MAEKILLQEKYGKRQVRINDGAVPGLHHTNGFVCDEAYLEEAGAVERGGVRVEYHVLRVYLKEAPMPSNTQPRPAEERFQISREALRRCLLLAHSVATGNVTTSAAMLAEQVESEIAAILAQQERPADEPERCVWKWDDEMGWYHSGCDYDFDPDGAEIPSVCQNPNCGKPVQIEEQGDATV